MTTSKITTNTAKNSMPMNKPELYSIEDCKVVNLPKHTRPNGNLTVAENNISLPFGIKRVYYIYDIPAGEERGGHAHKELQQFVIAVSGSFDVIIDDGTQRKSITLNRPYNGLHIRPGIWRELSNFSSGAVCLVLASEHYNEEDYIRYYDDFIKYRQER